LEEKAEGKNTLGGLRGRIILKWILKKEVG
jgi:hypothetical protein